jgi:hypothetical protein
MGCPPIILSLPYAKISQKRDKKTKMSFYNFLFVSLQKIKKKTDYENNIRLNGRGGCEIKFQDIFIIPGQQY